MEPKKPSFMDRVKSTLKDAKDRMFAEGEYDPKERSRKEREEFRTQADRERDGEVEYTEQYNYTVPGNQTGKSTKQKK